MGVNAKLVRTSSEFFCASSGWLTIRTSMLSMKGRTTSGARGINFFQKGKERLSLSICQFSKKQVLVSSETSAAAGRREAVGAGGALGEDGRGRGQEVCSPGKLKALTNKETNKKNPQNQQMPCTNKREEKRITSF